jgi:hypothetical protein
MIPSTQGYPEILKLRKTAFLCSRKIPASAVLKCYDWSIEQRNLGQCIISGFHSKIEKDVFHYLLAGKQPVIMALARGMKQNLSPDLKEAIDVGRLLIVTPFENSITRVTEETAQKRNRFMVELADDIVIGYARPGGLLDQLIREIQGKTIKRIAE